MLDIVIARHEEELFIHELDLNYRKIYIYTKGSPLRNLSKELSYKEWASLHTIELPNIGRESHTYLYHVIENYDRLADITFFMPGSAKRDTDKWRKVKDISKLLRENPSSCIPCYTEPCFVKGQTVFSLDYWNGPLSLSWIRPLGPWFSYHFPGEELSGISFHGIFAVKREDILKRPKEIYQKLLDELQFNNTEVGHYIERTWKDIFSIARV